MIGKGFNIFTYKFMLVLTMSILKNLRIVGFFLLIFTNWVLFIHIYIYIYNFIFNNNKSEQGYNYFLKNQSI